MKALYQKFYYFALLLLCSIMMSCDGPGWKDGEGVIIFLDSPTVSPDGTRIAFNFQLSGDTTNSSYPLPGLYIASINGTGEKFLFRNSGTFCWSIDGKKIATGKGIYTIENDIVKNFRPKSSEIPIFQISDWSPDGKTLLGFSETKVYLCDTLFQNIRELPITVFAPRWMPDGNHIIGEMWSSEWMYSEIAITDTLCSNIVRLTHRTVTDWVWYFTPAPSPDGSMIALNKSRTTIYVMNPDGSNLQFLTGGRYPAWTPDSKYIVYSKKTEGDGEVFHSYIWKISIDGKEKIQITNNHKIK